MSNSLAISWWEQITFWWHNDNVHFVLDQHAELDFVSSLKQQSAGRRVIPFRNIIWFQAFALLFIAARSNKYQLYSFWFDPIWAQTHDLPHGTSMQTITPSKQFVILNKDQSFPWMAWSKILSCNSFPGYAG